MREAPTVGVDETVEQATRALLGSGLPAIPVVDDDGRLYGIFGERELLGAVFPGYLKELHYAGFVKRSLDEALQRRSGARAEPVRGYVNTEHVDVGPDPSDAQVAEIFLHHRVLIVPVTEDGRVRGVITRSDFFRSVAERLLGGT